MSGGFSKSDASSQSGLDVDQKRYLQDTWGRGQGLMQQQWGDGGANQLSDLGANLTGQMQGMFGNLQQTAAGTSQAMQGLGAMGQVGGGNPYLQQNLDALGSGIQKQAGLLNQQLGGQAQMGGNFGGGRQGVMQGQLGGEALDAYQQGASGLMNQSAQQSLQANTAMGGLQTQAGLGGLQGAGSIFQMGQNPMMAQWLPMQLQQSLLGQNAMQSSSKSSSMAVQGGM